MRTMLKVAIPTERGNAAMKDGSFGKIVGGAIERLKPEAVYFVADHGQRSMVMVIDMADSTDMPRVAEPFFQGLDATVTFSPVMTMEDLQKGLAKMS